MRVLFSSLLFLGASACGSTSTPREARTDQASPASASVAPTPPAPAEDSGVAVATPDPIPPPPAPVTNVKLVTIGMHVAGGPFDEVTKEPFKKAVEPHFPEILQCWPKLPAPPKAVDVGVDLLIEGAGGKPKVSNPRSTTAKDNEFVPCIITVFETVEFPKLDRGRTGVSYSLRFTAK